MKVEIDLEKIKRVEVIDNRNSRIESPRAYASGKDRNMKLEVSVQDSEHTLKLFISDAQEVPRPSNLKVLKHVLKRELSHEEYTKLMVQYSELIDFNQEY